MKKLLFFLMLLFAVTSWANCTQRRIYARPDVSSCSLSGYNQISCNVTNTGESYNGCPDNYTAGCTSDYQYSVQGSCNVTNSGCSCFAGSCTCGISNGWITCCQTQCEADSISCVNAGNSWEYTQSATCGGMSCVEPVQCDTTMHCIEYPFNRCEDVQSNGSIYCDENGCSGLPYTRWFSEYRKECQNECGDHNTQSFTGDTLISFNSSCNDTLQCSEVSKCVDFPNTNTYLLYKVCIVGNEQIGNGANSQSYSQIVGGGSGSCASLGFPSNNIADPMNNQNPTTFPNTNTFNPVSDNCLIYGIDCPENFIDSTDYNDRNNRNPNHCICEKLDGMNHISTIICPDGSRTTFFGSCDEWNLPSSSSTNPPESSSSGSENPPTSSGGYSSGINAEYPDWPEYQKKQSDGNDLLGSMTQTLKQLPGQLLEGARNVLNGFAYNESDKEFIYDRVDSLVTLDTIIDTAGVLNAIFGRVDSTNRILDTLQHSSFTGCPCITFFNGNQQTDFSHGHLSFKEIKIELADLHGFNFCRIVSAIVVALASVVSFFIGFSIFKNISP